ncbi:heparan-alpha-glucosaminide N-acetyltransferase domain-containing protein [Maribacter chungangensis]|uniref:Heparan-alpha-glucosaminide N-acetyltransferase domain-containing protein n=1 Tax=Maribacter chungangensis TaxID=1069117 RepID=A0ABW3B3T0_9FLAO
MTKLNTKNTRLYFIDAIRAWAILMMLQGHFIDGLLDNAFRNDSNLLFGIWKYFRGITAPVFFTVSGFIFTYLLIKVPEIGWDNPRIKKGIRRGLELLAIGYLLRLNIFGLFKGEVYSSFYLVDVLHCIGLSILAIIGFYLITANGKKWLLPAVLVATTLVLFLFEPWYKSASFQWLPQWIANYFTKANGSVFTILPWLGYATFGSFTAVLFHKYKYYKYLYPMAIMVCTAFGILLIFYSSDAFWALSRATGTSLFADIFYNNYLFIRLGDVLLVFALFMLFRSFLTNKTLLRLGQSTLSIYVIHFVVLYGSFTGLGLYGFFNHSVSPYIAVSGAILFMVLCSYLALRYEDNKISIKKTMRSYFNSARLALENGLIYGFGTLRNLSLKLAKLFGLIKN